MNNPIMINQFEEIYHATEKDVVRFVVSRCSNMNDVNDIVQDVYVEFYKILQRKEIDNTNVKNYLFGIAMNKIKKYRLFSFKHIKVCLFSSEIELDTYEQYPDDFDLENYVIQKQTWNVIWDELKRMKNQNIPKIFYLIYGLGFKIHEVATELNVSESYVKNCLYRTIKQLNDKYGKEFSDESR